MKIKLRGRYKIIQKLGGGGGDTNLALDEDLPGYPLRVVCAFPAKRS